MSELKQLLRDRIRDSLKEIVVEVNAALQGKDLAGVEPILKRLGRGGVLPHWFGELKANGVLPNLDGKTIGSVVEMLFVAVVETKFISDLTPTKLKVNPARGIDLPDLDLGVKSPSTNFCTSEPFFSAYERLLGGEFDIVVLLTDYQTAKSKPPLRLQILGARFLKKTQVADANLCALASKHRESLLKDSQAHAKKYFRFLAFVNQSDWQAKQILKLLQVVDDPKQIDIRIAAAELDFIRVNAKALKADKELIPDEDIEALRRIRESTPRSLGLLDAADNWVLETWKDAGRSPNDNEWQRLTTSPLDGAIGMSFALQWRYNFGRVFGVAEDSSAPVNLIE